MVELQISNEETMFMSLVKEGLEEAEATEILDKLDEAIDLKMEEKIKKVGSTYITTKENLGFIESTYSNGLGGGFVPLQIE